MAEKIIFLDIDGTLTEPGKNIPPASALEAIRRAQTAGNRVFLCTGRTPGMVTPLLQYGFDGVVCASGGYITCGDTVIYNHPMTEQQKQKALDVLTKNGVFRTVECAEHSYTDESFKDFLRAKAQKDSNSELLRWREQIEQNLGILPMSAYRGEPIYKLVVMCEKRSQLDEPIEVLSDEFTVVVQDDPNAAYVNGEIISKVFDKGLGVKRVCEHLGIPVENTVGFGDSMNDLEMIETVGFSVCMANGSPTLKGIADAVCPAVTEDGMYQAFERYGLF